MNENVNAGDQRRRKKLRHQLTGSGEPSDALFCPRCREWYTGLQFLGLIAGTPPTCPACNVPVHEGKSVS